MALNVILLRHKIDHKKAALEALRAKDQDFVIRENELAAAIEEAETEEAQTEVEEEVVKFDTEKEAHEEAKSNLETEIADLERQLEEEEKRSPAAPAKERKGRTNMEVRENINIRTLPKNQRAFDALPMETRQAIITRDEVKTFLDNLRGMKGNTRAVSGAELTIPIVFLDLIAENMYRYSKLMNRVRIRGVNGEARQTIAGTVPEAVWIEMCGAINELTFVFNQISIDGWKVAGFVPVCNSILEDNDINLASSIVEMLSDSIGLAMDKAIIYGKGAASKMPLGIVTRLAQTTEPSDYPQNAPAWVDLHTSNILKVDSSEDAVTFWAELAMAEGNTFTEYARGRKFWVMNSRTQAILKSKLITFTAAGYLVSNLGGVMPIIDGDVDVLEFIPDGDIIGGYGDLYLLGIRSQMTIEQSREVQFIQDNTVFKGKQSADGQPVIPGAFVAINIKNTDVTTAVTFAADTANNGQLAELKIGSESLVPTFNDNVYTYAVTASAASDKIEATAAQPGAQVEITYDGANVRNGGTVTWKADSTAHPLVVTVRQGNAVRVYTVNVTKAGG